MKDVEMGSCGSWLLPVGRSTYAMGGKSPTGLGHDPNSHLTAQKHVPAGTRGARRAAQLRPRRLWSGTTRTHFVRHSERIIRLKAAEPYE